MGPVCLMWPPALIHYKTSLWERVCVQASLYFHCLWACPPPHLNNGGQKSSESLEARVAILLYELKILPNPWPRMC